MRSGRRAFCWFFGLLILAAASSSLMAWEEPIIVANEKNHTYEDKVSAQFGRLGEVYVSCQAHDETKSRKEIWLYKYSGIGRRGELVGKVSDGKPYCYEPDMTISPDGTVHVVWAEAQSGKSDQQAIMYRYYNNGAWGPITKLKTMNIPGTLNPTGFNQEKIDDLNLDVDSKGNVFVTFMVWPAARGKFLSRYGSVVTEETFPLAGRSKHPCVQADDEYVHLCWQQMLSWYTVYYARRKNIPGAKWEAYDIKGGVHRPVMGLDQNGDPHIVYMADDGKQRQVVYKNRIKNKFSNRLTITESAALYQNVEVAVKDDGNMIAVALVFSAGPTSFLLNWRKNGEWNPQGMVGLPGAEGKFDNPAVALSDKNIAAFAYNEPNAVTLILSEPIFVNEEPIPVIHANKDVFYYGDKITFDGRGSSDPDGKVVKYEWDFGDGTKAQGIEVSHTYLKQAGEMVVKLTVTDDRGTAATASKTINVLIQPPQPVITHQPDVVYWQDTVLLDGGGSADPFFDIVKYEWDFGDGSKAVGKTVSHPYVNKYGDLQVKLTVTNEKLVSATAVKTLRVNALYSASATFTKKKIRTLFLDRFGYEISWTANPKNSQAGYTVNKYRIYRKTGASLTYTLVTEVAPTETLYRDLSIEQSTDYTYAVCAVDALGHVSPVDNL
jgi:chitodextrinase